ncbi:MAG: hypothetical protein AB8B53_09615 [Flavobacteriales bacterium]
MRKLLLITVSTLLLASVQAQLSDRNCRPAKTTVSFGGELGLPSGEFNSSLGTQTFGFGGSFHTDTRNRIFQTGGNFSFARFGSYSDELSLYQGETLNGNSVFEEANVHVKHRIYRTHASMRLNPFNGRVQPYVEGLAGLKWFSSSAHISQYSGRAKEKLNKYNLERSFTSSYGWAAGVKIEAARGVFIEARYENLIGGQASFINPESFSMTSHEVFEYDMERSKTNISQIHIGVSLEFRRKCRNNTNRR